MWCTMLWLLLAAALPPSLCVGPAGSAGSVGSSGSVGSVGSTGSVRSVGSCSADAECAAVPGAVCGAGRCRCAPGLEPVDGGLRCVDVSPYHTSPCVETHQCAGLFTGYECRTDDGADTGVCVCQSTHHYFLGRCWRSLALGEPCSLDQECQGLRSPYAMSCDAGVCVCAPGHYLRQRGECRRAGTAPGDGCVLDEDCQFTNGACDRIALSCYDTTVATSAFIAQINITLNPTENKMASNKMATRQNGVVCSEAGDCASPFLCSSWGICVCPTGYYPSDDGSSCYAELGSPATEENCIGLYKEIQDGVCVCQANFYYEENMRDCAKAVRQFSDSCLSAESCWTLGAAGLCPEQGVEPWGLRYCACAEDAVADLERNMCRLFSVLGESCGEDADCAAGACEPDAAGDARCACPEPLTAVNGLCLATGLGLGDTCQVSEECTATAHLQCEDQTCSCANGYQLNGDVCSPALGGACSADGDCVVPDSVCQSTGAYATCQCAGGLLQHDSACWPASAGFNASCSFDAQCQQSPLGTGSACVGGACVCADTHNLVSDQCALMIGLFGACSRSSECFLSNMSDRVVCRNGFCQCDFLYPYSEELNTCTSSSTNTLANFSAVVAAIIYLIYQ